ncbi:MAG: hypothetical protein ABSA71_05830 [Desulfomonilia bacterium]|jgi:seryl-tRNA synthetase
MADHHPETVITLLRTWRNILSKEAQALSQGNLQDLQSLFQETSKIQHKLGKLLAASSLETKKDKNVSTMIRELLQEQEKFIDSLKTQTKELAQEIGSLKKSKTSLKGYKQKGAASPRFMNERT